MDNNLDKFSLIDNEWLDETIKEYKEFLNVSELYENKKWYEAKIEALEKVKRNLTPIA